MYKGIKYENFLFILAACLMVSLVNAAPAAQPRPQLNKKLQAAVQAAAQRHQGSVDLDKEDDFGNTPVFAAAQKEMPRLLLPISNPPRAAISCLKRAKTAITYSTLPATKTLFWLWLMVSAIFIRVNIKSICTF